MVAKKKSKKKVSKPYAGSKINRVRVVKAESIAADRHLVAFEAEVQGPLPIPVEALPVEITPDASEAEKKSWWEWLFGGAL